MKTKTLLAFGLCALLGTPALVRAAETPAPQVDVTFVSPENFTDFKTSSISTDRDVRYLSTEFTKHIKRIAREVLAPDMRLEVKFTDVNLAGEFEPQRGPQFNEVRIMKQIYPPRVQLEFKLLGPDGHVVSEGSRHLIDTNYLGNGSISDNDPLRHDKQMLTDWMHSEFAKKN